MMKATIDWEGVGPNLKKRVEEVPINGDQRIYGVDWEPLKDKPCYYSTEMHRGLEFADIIWNEIIGEQFLKSIQVYSRLVIIYLLSSSL